MGGWGRGGVHLLRGTDGAAAHAHPQCIRTGIDEPPGLRAGDNVPADDLQAWVAGLHMLQHGCLEGGVPCSPPQAAQFWTWTMMSHFEPFFGP